MWEIKGITFPTSSPINENKEPSWRDLFPLLRPGEKIKHQNEKKSEIFQSNKIFNPDQLPYQ
jgi:hypothetical protein